MFRVAEFFAFSNHIVNEFRDWDVVIRGEMRNIGKVGKELMYYGAVAVYG